MTLLIFTYLLAASLFVFSYYLDVRMEKADRMLISLSLIAAFVTLLGAVATTLIYSGNATMANFFFRATMAALAYFSVTLLRYAVFTPYGTKSRALGAFSLLLVAGGAYLLFAGEVSFHWAYPKPFLFASKPLFGLAKALDLFSLVFFAVVPAVAALVMLVRAAVSKSSIYRQRFLLNVASIAFGFFVSFVLFYLGLRYYWIIPLIPFGFAVAVILLYLSATLSTILDRDLVVSAVIRFVSLSFAFSVIAAALTVVVIKTVSLGVALPLALFAVVVSLLLLRAIAFRRLKRHMRFGSEYESDLERELESIDYSKGREPVIEDIATLFDRYIGATTVDFLVAGDDGRLRPALPGKDAGKELSVDDKAIAGLLSNNESIILKTQAITNHAYSEIKGELLRVFDACDAEALILLREGHSVVGIITLGAKKRGAEYSEYDYRVMSKLYSNFFLVMYYLKNIANESLVLTVDREIEFSGQIISSIQENIDRITHEKVDVDFITRSARKLGGDFIDFIGLGPDKYLFVMGDVSGKGLNASMSMVILKSVLRTFLSETGDFKKLVGKVNLFIKNNLPKGTFFAGVFGLLDFSTNTLYYINCGVPAMFLYTAAYNNAIEIQGDGKVLGFVRDVVKFLKVKKIAFNPEDVLLITTDGLTDATNLRGDRFGKDRVQKILMDNRVYPAGRIAKFLCDSLDSFVSREMEDDISVLVFKYLKK